MNSEGEGRHPGSGVPDEPYAPADRRDVQGRGEHHVPHGHPGNGVARPPGSGRRRSAWPVTWTLIGVCAAVWALQWLTRLLTPFDLATVLGYAPALTTSQPWRMLTSGFVHALPSPVHLLLNMYTLYLFGRMLEPLLGPWRTALLFVGSVLGGSAGVWLWGDPWVLVIGASGGVFGLFGAVFVFMRHVRADLRPITALIVINLAFGFLVGGVAWQAHLGGLITGALLGFCMLPGVKPRM